MNRGPIVVKGAFALDLMLDKEGNKYRKEKGIINPGHKPLPRLETVKDTVIINGIELPCWRHKFVTEESSGSETTEEERLEYRRLENMGKGEKILPEVTWEEFLRWLEVRDGVGVEDFCPCGARDGQCTWMCKYFGTNSEKCEKR